MSGPEPEALKSWAEVNGLAWQPEATLPPVTERLLKPMPDYQVLFGASDAKIGDKLDTLVISTPAPKDSTIVLFDFVSGTTTNDRLAGTLNEKLRLWLLLPASPR